MSNSSWVVGPPGIANGDVEWTPRSANGAEGRNVPEAVHLGIPLGFGGDPNALGVEFSC